MVHGILSKVWPKNRLEFEKDHILASQISYVLVGRKSSVANPLFRTNPRCGFSFGLERVPRAGSPACSYQIFVFKICAKF